MPRRKVTKRHKHLVYAREMKKRRGESQEGEETTVGLMHSDNQPASVPITITSSKSKTSPMARSRSPSMSPSDTGSIDLSDLQTQNICQDESFTRSEKKLIICCEAENDSDSEGPSSSCKEGRYVVDAIQMDLLVKSFPCRECMAIGTLSTSLKERRGLAVHLVFTCSSCNGNFDWWSSTSSTKQKSGRQKKVVNTAATFASLSSCMGATSFYNAALASEAVPGPHAKLVHTPLDEELLAEHLLPVYERLTEPALLKRCERKATQNANESLHNAIWAKCPKHKFYTRRHVEFATLLAVSEFNSGPYQLPDIRKLVGCSTSHHAIRLGSVRINRKAAVSRKEARDKKTNRRKMVREATRRRKEELTEAEGGPAYCAGMN